MRTMQSDKTETGRSLADNPATAWNQLAFVAPTRALATCVIAGAVDIAALLAFLFGGSVGSMRV